MDKPRSKMLDGGAKRRRCCGGVVLLEIILAVMMFSIAVIALGQCLNDCIDAQSIRAREAQARLALDNRMAEIIATPVLPDASKKEELDGPFRGITLVMVRKALDLRNEQNFALTGLYQIDLRAEWTRYGVPQSRSVSFILLRPGS